MKIKIASDLHLEVGLGVDLSADDADVLVLAGDIGRIDKPGYINIVNYWAESFAHVIYVCGNHEFWGSSIDLASRKLRGLLDSNVHILDCNSITIEDVRFLGCTLWTNLSGDPLAVFHADNYMNDFKKIRNNQYAKPFRALDSHSLHTKHVAWLTSTLANSVEGVTNIVVTHHAPSFKSVHPRYVYAKMANMCYATDLSNLILEYQPSLWIHGHMHDSFDYLIDNTRVICNPYGYHGMEVNPNFRYNFIVGV